MTDSHLLLQQEAEARGFLVSWAPIDLPEVAKKRYREWVSARYYATLGRLVRTLEIRLAPRERLDWARSVMVLAAPHAFPDPGMPEGGVRLGRVGRVFWIREQEFTRLLIDSVPDMKINPG